MDKLHSPFLASTQEAHTGLGVPEWTGHPILASSAFAPRVALTFGGRWRAPDSLLATGQPKKKKNEWNGV